MRTFAEHIEEHKAWKLNEPKHPGFTIEGPPGSGQWIKGVVTGNSLALSDCNGGQMKNLSIDACRKLRDQLSAMCPPESTPTPKEPGHE